MDSQTPAARWDVRLRGAAARAPRAVALEEFLAVLRDEEGRLPREERFDTKLTITRLRKLFYGGRGWDDHLIPGAADVAPLYPFTTAEPVRRQFEARGPNVVDFVDRSARLEGARPQLVRPGSLQEVVVPDGELVDLGHVLAGLDALNHPSTVAPLGLYEMSSNVDAVTWAGDLGSVLGEVLFQEARLRRPLTDAEVQAQIDLCAPAHDMLGNVDAYAIGAAYDISPAAGRAVSDILLDYYGAPPAPGSPRSHRFTTFARAVGLGRLEGDAFTAEPAWLARHELEIAHAAALYVGATAELDDWALPYAAGLKLDLMRRAARVPLRGTLLRRFVAAVRAEVAREAAQPVPGGEPGAGGDATT